VHLLLRINQRWRPGAARGGKLNVSKELGVTGVLGHYLRASERRTKGRKRRTATEAVGHGGNVGGLVFLENCGGSRNSGTGRMHKRAAR